MYVFGDLGEAVALQVVAGIFSCIESDPTEIISIIVNTYGGSVDDALAIYDAVQFAHQVGTPIQTIGLGKIMSAGCLILAAGDYRYMGKNSRLMFHAGFEQSAGTTHEQANNLKEFRRVEKLYDTLIARECGRTLAQVRELYEGGIDCYLTATQAKKFGFVDDVI